MQRLFLFLILALISSTAYAGAPDYRVSPYNDMYSSSDTAGSANTATRLSGNTSQPCMSVKICASKDNIGVISWGGSNVHWQNGPGTRLGGPERASCDTVFVDNVQDIYFSAQTAGDDVNYNYFR